MRTNPKQSEGHEPPRTGASHRLEWHLRAPFEEFRIVRQQDLRADETTRPVPWKAVLASMPSRSSLFSQRMYQGIYKVLTGTPLDLQLGWGEPKDLEHWVGDAFHNGTLVALHTGTVFKGILRMSEPVQTAGTSQSLPVLEHPPPPASPPSPLQHALAPPEPAPSTTFVAIKLVDEDGKPIPGMRYKLTLSDGSTREGRLNDQGEAREENVRNPGECQIEFLGFSAESDSDSDTLG